MNNDYERQREANIRKNHQLLAQLGLDVVKHALEPGPVRISQRVNSWTSL